MKVESLSHEFSRLKESQSKRPTFDEYLYVKDSVFNDRINEIEDKINGLFKKVETVSNSSRQYQQKDSDGVTSLDLS